MGTDKRSFWALLLLKWLCCCTPGAMRQAAGAILLQLCSSNLSSSRLVSAYPIPCVRTVLSMSSSALASPSPTPPLPALHPTLHAATTDYRGGHRPFLDVIFDASLAYDGVRRSILQNLTTTDFHNLRQTCRSIDFCLMMPLANGHSRYVPDLIDQCDEFGLPAPPSLLPRGSCPNPPQSTTQIRACQCDDYRELRNYSPHQAVTPRPRDHLVCEVCRHNWHDNIGQVPGRQHPNHMSRHDYWRVTLAQGHITLCKLCDQEQKRQYYPQGHDGCVCYREYYQKRWLCQRCDIRNRLRVLTSIVPYAGRRRRLRQAGNLMLIRPDEQGPPDLPRWLSWCPCGRQVSEVSPPKIQRVPNPWPGNHNIIAPVLDRDTRRLKQTTKQCVLCCGYIVPPVVNARQPTRRSARLADRKSGRQGERRHTMLDRSGKAATRDGVNARGFEVRRRGGW